MGSESLDVLRAQSQSLYSRVSMILQSAFRERDESLINQVTPLSNELQSITKELLYLSDDVDGSQRISRNLIEIETEIELIESRDQLIEIRNECEEIYFSTSDIVNEFGDETDKRILKSCATQMNSAFNSSRQGEVERIIERLEQLYNSAHSKSPAYWKDLFLIWASYIDVATNPKKANKLVEEGHQLVAKETYTGLKRITSDLYELIPSQFKNHNRPGSHESGIY